MLKKITALLLSGVALLSFAACGNNATQDTANTTTTTASHSSGATSTTRTTHSTGSTNAPANNTDNEVNNMLTITVTPVNKKSFSSSRVQDPSKENVSLILVTGQSNFTTGVGYSAEYSAFINGKTTKRPEAPVAPVPGTAYSFSTYSTSFELNNDSDMNTLCRTDRSSVLGGVTPSFAIEWYKKTNTKVVFVQAAVGAVGVHEWTPDPSKYECTCAHNGGGQLYERAVRTYKRVAAELSKNYNIVYTGYIWNQGEHDEVYGTKPGVTVCDAESYYDAYKEMHNGFMNTLNLDFGGISVVRANNAGSTAQGSNSYTIARAAQYRLCNDIDNLYMLSTISETCSRSMMDRGNTIHYSQAVFNQMGAEMADSLFSYLKLGAVYKYNGIRIYGADGSTVVKTDATGKITVGNGRLTGSNCGDNIIIRPETLGTHHKIEWSIQVGGVDYSKYIDRFGEIDWDGLSKEANITELNVSVIVK